MARRKFKIYDLSEVRKLAGEISHQCAIELLKAGNIGKRSTRANFSAHKECIKRKFMEETKKRLGALS